MSTGASFTIYTPTKWLPHVVDHKGVRRACGHVPSRRLPMSGFAPPMAPADLIPPADYEEFELPMPSGVMIKDQGQVGACNTHSETLNLQLVDVAAGRPNVALSAWAPYGWLTNGHDIGSSPVEGLDLLQTRGTPPDAAVAHGNYFPQTYGPQILTEAARFRCEKGVQITTDDELATAIQRLSPVTIAIPVGDAFSDLDAEGVAPLAAGYCNHAVSAVLGMKRAKNGQWIFKVANSWGVGWGLDGFFWLYLAGTTRRAGFEAVMFQSGTDDPQDKGLPVLAA